MQLWRISVNSSVVGRGELDNIQVLLQISSLTVIGTQERRQGKRGPLGFLKLCWVNWRLSDLGSLFTSLSSSLIHTSSVCLWECYGRQCQKLFSWNPELWTYYFSHLLRILNSTIPRLPPTFTSLTSCSLFKISGPADRILPPAPWSGTYHQCTLEASWIVCALLCCPSRSFWGWLKFPLRTSACKCEASSRHLKKVSSTSPWTGGL